MKFHGPAFPLLLLPLLLTGCGGTDDAPPAAGVEGAQSAADEAPAKVPENADGVMTATMDGEKKTWYLLSREMGGERHSQSEWRRVFGGGAAMVTLFGHSSPETLSSDNGLMIDFTAVESRDGAMATGPDITSLPGGDIRNMFLSKHPGNATVDITEYAVEDDILTIAGAFSGILVSNTTGDTSDPVSVENGTFRARVRHVSDDR